MTSVRRGGEECRAPRFGDTGRKATPGPDQNADPALGMTAPHIWWLLIGRDGWAAAWRWGP